MFILLGKCSTNGNQARVEMDREWFRPVVVGLLARTAHRRFQLLKSELFNIIPFPGCVLFQEVRQRCDDAGIAVDDPLIEATWA